jgi:hypothetical protein
MVISATQSSKTEFADWPGVLAQHVIAERFSTKLERPHALNSQKN